MNIDNTTDIEPILDLYISIANGFVASKFMIFTDKCDDFDSDI